MILSQACSVSCPFRPPLMLWKLCGNDEPALEAIYEDRHRSFGCALYIWNSIHTAWRVHYQPPKYIKHCSELTLTLFVLWIFADNANASFSFNYFAFFANRFNWWSYLHSKSSFLYKSPVSAVFRIFQVLSKKCPNNIIHRHLVEVNIFFIYLSRWFFPLSGHMGTFQLLLYLPAGYG